MSLTPEPIDCAALGLIGEQSPLYSPAGGRGSPNGGSGSPMGSPRMTVYDTARAKREAAAAARRNRLSWWQRATEQYREWRWRRVLVQSTKRLDAKSRALQ